MFGQVKRLAKFLSGPDTRFIIPVYQRNYDWKLDNCKQLFDDLVKLSGSGRETHFFGSIVEAGNCHGQELIIIDGQQRITTITLLLLAIMHLLDEGKVTSGFDRLSDKIKRQYLIDEWSDDKKVKLKPIKDDQAAFELLFESPDEYNRESNITQNYMYFYNRIQKNEISIDNLFKAVGSLEIIDISLDEKDDAQLIFQSLNSTGLSLSEGDKIRNFILMKLDSDIQEKYYYKYWNKIEKETSYDVSDFIRHYMAVISSKTPAIKDVYRYFKQYVEDKNIETEELLKNLLRYAKYYNTIKHANTNNRDANAVLGRLGQLDRTIIIPYLLSLFDYKENNVLEDKEFIEVLSAIETYIFRRMICGLTDSALNKIFIFLHRDCLRYKKENDKYSEVLKYLIISKPISGRLPDDREFLQCLEEKNIYSMHVKNKTYLFDRLENGNSVERNNVIQLMQEGKYTIEHIMPQTLSDVWKKELGDNYNEIYEKWVNRLANLTLTGYNIQYSNRSFEQKKNVKDGFKESGLRLNKIIAECNKWTEEELVKRNDILKEQALELWPYPVTDFIPFVAINERHPLSEDFNYTGRNLISYTFMDTPYQASAWTEMYQQVVKFLFEMDVTIIYQLVHKDNGMGLSFTDIETNGYVEIDDRVYLFVGNSTMAKINNLRKLFARYNLEEDELILEIQSQDNSV